MYRNISAHKNKHIYSIYTTHIYTYIYAYMHLQTYYISYTHIYIYIYKRTFILICNTMLMLKGKIISKKLTYDDLSEYLIQLYQCHYAM